MYSCFRITPLMAAIAFLHPISIFAEEGDTKIIMSLAPEVSPTTPVMLDEIVVSASKEGTALRKTPAAISKINGKTLDEKKATFMGQVLNQVPGVYVTDLGNEQHNMSIRQPLSYNAVYLYMEDGISIRPAGLFNHNSLYELNLDGEGAIEVMKGPASSLYGNNAIGGAVNFMTRAPSKYPEGYIGTQLSDQGYRRLDFGFSNSTANQGLRISGYASERAGGWQKFNDADKQSITVRHDAVISDTTTLKTILTYNRLFTDMPGSLNQTNYQANPGFSYYPFTWRHVEAARASTTLEGHWNTGGLTTLTAFVRNNITNQLPSYLIFGTSGRIVDQNFHSIGVDAHHRQDVSDKIRLIVGATIDNTPMNGYEQNLGVTRNATTGIYTGYTIGSTRRDYTVNVDSKAIYGQLEYTPIKALRFVAGGRYDSISYDYTNHLNPSSTTGAPSESRRYNHFSPKLGGIWSPSKNVSFYSNISQGFAPPEVSAKYGGSAISPDLVESVFTNIDGGVRWSSNDKTTTADVSVYRLTGKNEQLSLSLQPGQSIPTNAGKTRHQGIEFGLWYKPTHAWDAKLNGSYAHHNYMEYNTGLNGDFSGKEIQSAPRWLVNAEWGYRPIEPLRVSAEVQYVGAYWMDNADMVRYPGHTLLNLRARYAQQGPWELWGSVLNVTNKHYAEIAASTYTGSGARNPDTQDTYSPGNPRTFLVGLRYNFGGAK